MTVSINDIVLNKNILEKLRMITTMDNDSDIIAQGINNLISQYENKNGPINIDCKKDQIMNGVIMEDID
jgi:hypothetical protein